MGLESFVQTDVTDSNNNTTDEDATEYYTSEDDIGDLGPDMLRGNESPQHAIKKREKAVELVNRGYKVAFEKRYRDYVIDVFGKKDGNVLLIEVGNTTKSKMNTLREDDSVKVKNVPYEKGGREVVGVCEKRGPSLMRPKIPIHMVQQLDEETDKYVHSKEDRNMKVYEVGGFSSKGEFIRQAAREKIKQHKEKYDIE